MMTKADTEQWRERAKQAVDRFVWRFDESYLQLAYHAALPLVLTPELVNYLRNEFLRGDQVPWVAEVDLLLSDLCSQVGYELYAMDSHVRAYLLDEIKDKLFWQSRMQQVAQVLISYVSYLSRINPGRRQQELEAQRWAAMVYLGDESCKKAAREIAERLQHNTKLADVDGSIRAELARLARITEELSSQLQEQPSLVEYAKLVQRVLRMPEAVKPEELHSYQVDGVELSIPDNLLPEKLKTAASPSGEMVAIEGLPPIHTFEFDVATIAVTPEINAPLEVELHPFDFDVATIEVNQTEVNQVVQINTDNLTEVVDQALFAKTGKHLSDVQTAVILGTWRHQTYSKIAQDYSYPPEYLKQDVGPKLWKVLSEVFAQKVTKSNFKTTIEQWAARRRLTIHRHRQQAREFIEDLGNGVQLEMVAIPEGNFVMGSPEDEPQYYDYESPQHTVTIKSFFLGKYPVTQAQWQAVASLPQVNRELDPDPSRFKGANRPVERVSWFDAVEFCDRLSQKTGREYRLPSEAEWEYACRAGTTTPFHFGETITPELANYDGNDTYGAGTKGASRGETTDVGSFGVANAFGLYDMHGNVWEWCADHWHENYEGAPTEGKAWLKENDNDNQKRVLRGGSWNSDPRDCRSAYRYRYVAGFRNSYFGVRVACAAARTM